MPQQHQVEDSPWNSLSIEFDNAERRQKDFVRGYVVDKNQGENDRIEETGDEDQDCDSPIIDSKA